MFSTRLRGQSKRILFYDKFMTDYRVENQYILSFSNRFLKDFDLESDSFIL
jgi:hypothetical protein